MAYTPQNTNGQKTSANSSPVVLASDQSVLPISTLQAIGTTNTILQNAVAVTGNGVNLTVTGYGTTLLLITGTFVATVNFEASSDAGTNWFPISATFVGGGDIATTATTVGQYRLTTTGIDLIRARVTWTSGTSITIIGRSINSINASKIIALATGSKVIGKVSIDQTTPGTTNAVSITNTNLPAIADITNSGSLAALNATLALSVANGYSGTVIQVTGTWVGTIQFEGTLDGTNWSPINGVFAGGTAPAPTITANGIIRLTPGGLQQIRVNMIAFTSGSATVSMRTSQGSAGTFLNQSLTVGGNVIGKVGIDQTTPGTSNAVSVTNTSIPVTGTFFQATQPVSGPITDTQIRATALPISGTVGVNNFPATQAVTGTFFQTTQPVSIAAMPSTPVTGTFFQATQPVSGTFFQATQPVSLATNTPDVTDRAGRLLGQVTNAGTFAVQSAATLQAGTAIAGKFGIDQTTPGTTNAVSVTNASLAVTGTFFQATQPVSLATNTPTLQTGSTTAVTQATAANLQATITPQTLTKGTQGAVGITTQDLKDAGRNAVHYYTIIPVLTSATDTLQSLTGTKASATVVATTTPAVVTTAKTFRVTRLAATYIATAVSGYGIIRLRFQPAGVVTITSPVAATLTVGSSAPTTANATDTEEASLADGWEFAAGVGVGISVQGFSAVTPTAVGYVIVSVTGYEY